MVVWRCPHCATPQAEAARCWVCHRSTTSCASCRHFRPSVASRLGVCGLDPRATALTGAEMRVCWTPPQPGADEPADRRPTVARPAAAAPAGRAPRTFVPVEDLRATAPPDRLIGPAVVIDATSNAAPGATPRWSLWDELER